MAGQNQAGCVPESGTRRPGSQGAVGPTIPLEPTGRRVNPGDATGSGLRMAGAEGMAEAEGAAEAAWPCGLLR